MLYCILYTRWTFSKSWLGYYNGTIGNSPFVAGWPDSRSTKRCRGSSVLVSFLLLLLRQSPSSPHFFSFFIVRIPKVIFGKFIASSTIYIPGIPQQILVVQILGLICLEYL